MENVFRCKRNLQIIKEDCKNISCRWHILGNKFLNCLWVACNYGPFSYKEIGEMIGLGGEGVRKIETKAIIKLKNTKVVNKQDIIETLRLLSDNDEGEAEEEDL